MSRVRVENTFASERRSRIESFPLFAGVEFDDVFPLINRGTLFGRGGAPKFQHVTERDFAMRR
jgi:hypothetical protein